MTTPPLRELVEALGSPLEPQRAAAREALVSAGEQALPLLQAALGHRERDIRANACLVLIRLRNPGALSALLTCATEDRDPEVRLLAQRALADLASPSAPPRLRSLLDAGLASPDPMARALACQGLGRIGDEAALGALRKAEADPDSWVRDAARRSLAAATVYPRTDEAQGTVQALAAPREAVPERASLLRGVKPLVAGLLNLDPEAQKQAAQALIDRGPEVIPHLRPLLLTGPPEAQRAAIEVLSALGHDDGLPPLAEVLAEPRTPGSLRAEALHGMARLLGRQKPRSERPLPGFPQDEVRLHLCHEDPLVRAAAAAALLSAGRSLGPPTLAWLLDEEVDPWPGLVALRTLNRVADPDDGELTPLLLDLLARTTDGEGQLLALSALGRIHDRPRPEQPLPSGPVSFFLASDDDNVRRAAARLLANAAAALDETTLQALLREACLPGPDQVALLRGARRLLPAGLTLPLPPLRRLLQGGDLALAREAVLLLSQAGTRPALEVLAEVANSRSGPVVALAAQTLASPLPRAPFVAMRGPDGRWQVEARLWCRCGGLLRFVLRDRREELRCPQCDADYVQTVAGKLLPADQTPYGTCSCPGCARKQPLVRRGTEQVLVCPVSQAVHVRPFDHPRQVRLLASLPLGACSCCAEPQPLIRLNAEVVCYRTHERYRPAARGFERDSALAAARDEVAAINQALLMGTLGLGESGLAGRTDGEDE